MQNKQTDAIVAGTRQQLCQVYEAEQALCRGTLYPELDKPMACAANPSGCPAPTDNQIMGFSAWEVRLYLNTHPHDMNALQLYQQLCQQAPKPNYACTFVPCTVDHWSWVDDPWPWECEANGRRG